MLDAVTNRVAGTAYTVGTRSGAATDSAYTQWGWRIPFVVGGLLGVAFFWYFHRCIDESEVWMEASAERAVQQEAPLRQLFNGRNSRRLAQVFILMSGLWFAVQAIISPMSSLLINNLEQDPGAVTAALLIANVALFLGYLALGHLGQKYGRRKVLLLAGAGTATISAIGFFTAISILDGGGSFGLALAIYTVGLIIAISPYGVATVYLLEAFPTRVRATGYGFAYSVSLVIPSFYSLYLLGLSAFLPYIYTPVVLIVLSGVLTFVGAKMGPETRETSFTEAPRAAVEH